jgi:1-acyl-sn-glycerol-3-phosphate acyltransferase
MNVIKKIWILLVKLCGWKLIVPEKGTRPEVERCIFVVAPHTSAFDFIFGAAFLWSCSSNGKVFIKKEFFRWPLGPILKGLGCVSIDRGNRKNDMVGTAVRKFDEGGPLSIAITPEATRKPTKKWKKGFWEIAKQANIPIVPAYWDFEKKEIGIFDTIIPSDNYEEDLKKVRSLYSKKMAKYPDMYIEA